MKIEDFPTSPVLEDYDWKEALEGQYPQVHVVIGSDASSAQFHTPDVAAVHEWYAHSEGSDTERYCGDLNLYAVLELTDGRWAFLDAWCDTTGWGCQDDSIAHVASSREELIKHGIGVEEARLLNITKEWG